MRSSRHRRHPVFRAVLFAVAAFSVLALGVFGAFTIPVSGRHPFHLEDCGPVMACFPPNYHTPLRVLTLLAAILVALALSAAGRRRATRAT